MDKTEIAVCALCGEPMPPGEEMFNYHGYSGPCPKPPLSRPTKEDREASLLSTIKELMEALEMLQRQALQSELNTPSHEWGWEALQVTRTALSRAKSLMEQKP